MVYFPGAIILVNNDLSPGVQGPLMRQLYIDEAIYAPEFMARIAADPNYPQIVHGNNLRILVIEHFNDGYYGYNRSLADIVIFIKAGLASIEKNMFDCSPLPSQTFPVDTLTIYQLIAKYPVAGTMPIPDNVQNNILVPMFPHAHEPKLYPFGSDPICPHGGKGADIIDEDND